MSVQLADAHPHRGARIMRNLKTLDDYYNRQQPTLGDFVGEIGEKGFGGAVANRFAWGNMRMLASDIEDVQGFIPLINGKSAAQNWTAEFKPGERIRLRFINSSAMAFFDIRIPGLEILVVNADGNNVQPTTTDEFRLAVAETFDVIVRPKEARAYSIIAESMGRTALGRATLMPEGETVAAEPLPELRQSPRLTFADMALAHGTGHAGHSMAHGEMHDEKSGDSESTEANGGGHAGHSMADNETMAHGAHANHAAADGAAAGMQLYADGSGLVPQAANGGKFLSYNDLRAQKPLYPLRPPTREITLRLTGNMERYSWSINDVKHHDSEPLRLQYGERVRFKFINETMMTHPMHLHGMWSILDVGAGEWNPRSMLSASRRPPKCILKPKWMRPGSGRFTVIWPITPPPECFAKSWWRARPTPQKPRRQINAGANSLRRFARRCAFGGGAGKRASRVWRAIGGMGISPRNRPAGVDGVARRRVCRQ